MRGILIIGLAILSLTSCVKDEMNCVADRNDNGRRQSMIMSKEPYPYKGFKYEYRLGCAGAHGSLLLSAEEYEIGDWYTLHQDYEEGLNQGI